MASLDFTAEKEAFKEFYDRDVAILRGAADSLRTLLSLLLTDNDAFATPQVLGRVKDREECIAKFARKYQAKCEESQTPYEIKDYISDLVGLRVICLYETDIQLVRQVLASNFEILEESDKAQVMESRENVFGYKGLHLDLRLLSNRRELPEYRRFRELRFEVQVRTIVQDAWSVLDHKIKYKKSIPHALKRRINRLAALFELADQEFLHIRDETRSLEEQATADIIPTAQPIPIPNVPAVQLNAFSFLTLAQRHFPAYHFLSHKVDGFVEEILEVDPMLTAEQMEAALVAADSMLQDYREYQQQRYLNRLNPYTTIRHALYLYNREKYAPLLFDLQRNNFISWLDER